MGKNELLQGQHILDENTVVDVGHPVEITRQETRALEANAREMSAAAFRLKRGWLLIYMRAHKRSMLVLQAVIRRSHAQTQLTSFEAQPTENPQGSNYKDPGDQDL